MRNPESFSGETAPINSDASSENEKSAETLRGEYQARGEEANEKFLEDQEFQALLKRKAELEAKLRAAGVEIKDDTKVGEINQPAEVSPNEVGKKIHLSKGAKIAIGVAAGAVVASALLTLGIRHFNKQAEAANTISGGPTVETVAPAMVEVNTPAAPAETVVDNSMYAGETINGVSYDYTEYADRDEKVAYNAYGYNYEHQYGNREEATKGIMHMATTEPEAMASYAYNIFTDAEKAELGIKDMTMVEIDEKMDAAGGGELQKKLLDKFHEVLTDEKTNFNFYHENNTENTNYIYFVDGNEDGNYTPDELHLGYDTKKRNNAPQVDISRTIKNADGTEKTVKMLDLNMECGYQPNYEQAPDGVPKIDENGTYSQEQVVMGGGAVNIVQGGGGTQKSNPPKEKPPENKPPKEENPPEKEWGKSGDPHAGTDYGQTIVTNPAVEDVSNINDGNKGYVDDNQAAPGAPSEYNGVDQDTGFAASGIVAEGATTDGGRLEGGADQSDGQMAGENAYHSEADTSAGQAADAGGNDAQESAQENNDVGGDNNSDSQEESRVAEGDF